MGLAKDGQNTRGFLARVDVFLKDGEYPMYVVIHEDFCRYRCLRYIYIYIYIYMHTNLLIVEPIFQHEPVRKKLTEAGDAH